MIRPPRTYSGARVPFSEILPQDDFLHPAEQGADFTAIETYLLGFNAPEADINSNIYLLWRPKMGVMSAHIFVAKGARSFRHQLEADYFNEFLYLPASAGPGSFDLQLGSCTARIEVVDPLRALKLRFSDPERKFELDVTSSAILPPVGRPGGKHFTQLIRNAGHVKLDGQTYAVNSPYMRDRSWSYGRPERPETTPPYRWVTAWFDDGSAFVIAWLDVGMLNHPRFADDWQNFADASDATGRNKWESGGQTPSLNLRSGWICGPDGKILAVTRVEIEGESAPDAILETAAISLAVHDEAGTVRRIRGTARQMFPKMYWQNLLVHMHMMDFEMDGVRGMGDLMDTFTTAHIRFAAGLPI